MLCTRPCRVPRGVTAALSISERLDATGSSPICDKIFAIPHIRCKAYETNATLLAAHPLPGLCKRCGRRCELSSKSFPTNRVTSSRWPIEPPPQLSATKGRPSLSKARENSGRGPFRSSRAVEANHTRSDWRVRPISWKIRRTTHVLSRLLFASCLGVTAPHIAGTSGETALRFRLDFGSLPGFI